jgi:hypothetical protein
LEPEEEKHQTNFFKYKLIDENENESSISVKTKEKTLVEIGNSRNDFEAYVLQEENNLFQFEFEFKN